MNDDLTDLENELRALTPRAASTPLEDRIGSLLDRPAQPRTSVLWWHRLGFNHPLSALGWGLLSPGVTAAVVVLLIRPVPPGLSPSPAADHVSVEVGRRAMSGQPSAVDRVAGEVAPVPAHAINIVYTAADEGVVLDNGAAPVRRVRYRSADLVQWHDPSTGARWEVAYPREDVRFVPLKAD